MGAVDVDLPSGLRSLDLSGNQLTALPTSWPDSLEEVDFYENQISSFPAGMPALPAGLTLFRLGDNKFSGPLPTWALPSGLKRLDLDKCMFTGSIPSTWTIPNGMDLLLMNNDLTGTLPPASNFDGRSHTAVEE